MVEIRVDDKALARALEKAIPAAVTRNLRAAVSESLAEHLRKMKTQFTGFTGQTSGDSLQRRTGSLLRSLRTTRVSGSSIDDIEGRNFTTSRYAPVHEGRNKITQPQRRFTTIKSKRPGGYLKIPMPSMLTAGGDLSEAMVRRVKGAEEAGETFLRPIRSNTRDFVVLAPRAGGGVVPVYALKRSVRIPSGRLRWFDNWEELAPRRRQIFTRRMNRALAEGTRR